MAAPQPFQQRVDGPPPQGYHLFYRLQLQEPLQKSYHSLPVLQQKGICSSDCLQQGQGWLWRVTKGDKTVCINCHVTSLLSSAYSILSNILLSRFSQYTDEITGDHQCGFQHNRSATDQIYCNRQILENIWEYNETVHQLIIDYKKAYDSVRMKVLYSILIEFGVPMKLVRLIKMSLNKTYSEVRIGKHLSNSFPIQNGQKQGDALSPLLFNFALEYAIRKVGIILP
jgi:hypothetical protein